jgi:hypothetical protein
MRRILVVPLLSLLALLVAPVPAAPADADGPRSAELGSVWKVVDGAAAEARFRVLCQPEDGFVFLSLGLRQGGVHIASGTIAGVPCTGEVERVVVALQAISDVDPRRVRSGAAVVYSNLWNCVDGRDPCFEMEQDTPATIEGRRFVTPFDEDYRAGLTLVRHRLLADGRVRVVYDLTCEGTGFAPGPVGSTITQVTPRGRLIFGAGGRPADGSDVECSATPTRFRFLVTPTAGRFRSDRAFIDTDFGSRYDWGVFADDQHPMSLRR